MRRPMIYPMSIGRKRSCCKPTIRLARCFAGAGSRRRGGGPCSPSFNLILNGQA